MIVMKIVVCVCAAITGAGFVGGMFCQMSEMQKKAKEAKHEFTFFGPDDK